MPVLQFKGKTAVETYHHAVAHHALELDKKRSVLAKGEAPSLDGNLIVEGDNLLALKSLLPTHAGRIKCIYIDPPYNTGNEGWVYNDNLTQPQFKEWINQTVGKEGEDACRHDKWLCMMYPRLQLLKELLRDDGAIFISIDDNEVHHLRMAMDEVFGVECFIAQFTWKARQYPDARAITGVSTDHEYIVVYGKTPEARLRGGERDESKYSNPDKDKRGLWMSRSILGLADKTRRPNLHYPITDPKTKWTFVPPAETGWRYERATMDEKIAEKRILFPKERDGRPREKVFLEELKTKFPGLSSIVLKPHTADGTEEVRQIFGSGIFMFPKPSELIRIVAQQITTEDEWILDSFSGSGTTAHAVLELNKEDGGNRKFILVQQPYDTKENEKEKFNICEKITAERVRRVMEGYSYKTQGGKTEKVAGLGGSFTYARVSAKPLLGEYRSLGEEPPAYDELARYVFYTETSRQWDPKEQDEKIGRLGGHAGASYYLLYRPNGKDDWRADLEFLTNVARKDKNKSLVVYCEKIWLHREDLRLWEQENKKIVRLMQVPFNLK